MDIKTTIIGVILLLICILPLLLLGSNKKNKQKKMLESLFDFAQQNNSQITQHEIMGEILLGIDEKKSHLFFMKYFREDIIKHQIDLHEIQFCKIKNSSRSINNTSIVEKLELQLIPKDKNQKEKMLEFFNNDHSNQMVNELQTIEKWNILVNEHLKK